MNAYHVVLAVMLLVTGSMNTLLTKWTDLSTACGVYCDHGREERKFNHPFVQAFTMFIGEFICFIVFFSWMLIGRLRAGRQAAANDGEVLVAGALPPLAKVPGFAKWFLFLPPALCDMIATSTIYIGLNLTFASSFQMLRGSVILFTGLLSVAFLGRSILRHMWVGMGIITAGLVCVGVSDIIFNSKGNISDSDLNGIIAGDLLIILAQIISATQCVCEEKFLRKHNFPPLLAVGLEGMFGMVIIGVLLAPMYHIPASIPFTNDPGWRLENALDAFAMMRQNWHILVGVIGGILSIAVFNFSSITIVKEVSGTSRMVLDSGRTLIIWAFSLAVGWQPFSYRSFLLQLAGFALLLVGMCVYNDLIFAPWMRRRNWIGPVQTASGGGEDDFEPRYREGESINDVSVEDRRLATSGDGVPLIGN